MSTSCSVFDLTFVYDTFFSTTTVYWARVLSAGTSFWGGGVLRQDPLIMLTYFHCHIGHAGITELHRPSIKSFAEGMVWGETFVK